MKITIGGNEANLFSKNVKLSDSVELRIGSSNDLKIYHGGTHSFIDNETGNLYIRNYSDDKNIHFQTDDGSGGITDYIVIHGQENIIKFQEHTRHLDNKQARFGTGSDLKILHNGTDSFIQNFTGTLQIQNQSDDKDILLRSDDGSGGVATYFYLDGSTVLNRFPVHARWDDSIEAQFGAGADLKIYHDASNSIIRNDTGDLRFIQYVDDGKIRFYNDNEILPNPDNIGLGIKDGRSKLNVAYDPSNFLFSKAYGQIPSNTTLIVKYLQGGGLRSNVRANTITQRGIINMISKPNVNSNLLNNLLL